MKLLKELVEARYYQSPYQSLTPGRAVNKIVREIFGNYGRDIFASYNDKYRTVRRLSYQPIRKDSGPGSATTSRLGVDENIPAFQDVSDDILADVDTKLREAGFRNYQVNWHSAQSWHGDYTKLVVKLPLKNQ